MWNLYYIKKADSPVHCYTEVISFTSGFDKIKGEPHSLYLIFNYEKIAYIKVCVNLSLLQILFHII